MTTQTKPSELYVAARAALESLEVIDRGTNVDVSGNIKWLKSALENHKPAPLPDAVVELIEHYQSEVLMEFSSMKKWIEKALQLSYATDAYLPRKHRCVREGCEGEPKVFGEFPSNQIGCQTCGLTTGFYEQPLNAWKNWYQNDSGVYEGDAL